MSVSSDPGSRVLRIRLSGAEASLGRIAAADVARVLLGVEQAVARASGHVLGRQLKATGRREGTVERATRFRLRGIEPGSVIGVLELPEATSDADEGFDLDVATLGETALERAVDVARGARTDEPDVARAWMDLLESIGVGDRIGSITLETGSGPGLRVAALDAAAQARLALVAERGLVDRHDSLTGVLVEADFERRTARLRSFGRDAVSISFDDELADAIQEALRTQAEFEGEVVYDPRTSKAVSVRLNAITRADQMDLGIMDSGRFRADISVYDLIREQGTELLSDFHNIEGPSLGETDPEVDAFLAALGIEA